MQTMLTQEAAKVRNHYFNYYPHLFLHTNINVLTSYLEKEEKIPLTELVFNQPFI